MSKIDSLLETRLSKSESKEKALKVRGLAEKSNSGQLSGYATLLGSASISVEEKEILQAILLRYKKSGSHLLSDIPLESSLLKDLEELSAITQEVKSITQQSILLHGERIHKAQQLLSSYNDGAFSAWLITTYGNRQTPYNFLLYYQLHVALEESLREKLEEMPKQAVYTLAGRKASLPQKIELIQAYKGATKAELLEEIRRRFPLAPQDKRKGAAAGTQLLHELKRLTHSISTKRDELSGDEKEALKKELKNTMSLLLQL